MNSLQAPLPTLQQPEDVVLRVEKLGKCFKLYPGQAARIKEWLTFGLRSYHKDFWAVSDVSFEVHRGEFLGIIGPNGAGKSTLLKLITGVLDPSSGSCVTSGKVLSLLELSGGMDDDLTGRQNVIRSAQLLGFPDNYARERMQEIAEFAELNEFFDAPMSVYSSGMRIRLAFSLFAFLDCDILILDEVLAVGDIFFKQKCFARLEELIKKNTAIVLVTHSTSTVLRYCRNVLVLNHGKIAFNGGAEKAIQHYFQIKSGSGVQVSAADTYIEDERPAPAPRSETIDWPTEAVFASSPSPEKLQTRGALLTRMAVCDESGQARQVFKQGEKAHLYFEYRVQQNMGVPVSEFNLMTVQNLRLHSRNTLRQKDTPLPRKLQAGDILRFHEVISLDIAPGEYIFSLDLLTLHPDHYDQLDLFSHADLLEKLVTVSRAKPAGTIQVFDEREGSRTIHVGMCDLAGQSRLQLLSAEAARSAS